MPSGALIQPVVLAGGASRRFGRDKLVEDVETAGGRMMLAAWPVKVLRAVFESPVAIVGACDERVAALGDMVIEDGVCGVGPIGGIATALRHFDRDLCVLSGDLPWLSERSVRLMVSKAGESSAAVLVAETDRVQPCICIYRKESAEVLEECIDRGSYSLVAALAGLSVERIAIPFAEGRNINRQDDLEERGDRQE